MSDIRRTVLWAVFGLSLVMLWDRWQIHQGKPPLFFPSAQQPKATPALPTPTNPTAATNTSNTNTPAGVANGNATAPDTIKPQLHTLTTDVLQLTFSTEGGSLVGAQMRQHAADINQSASKNGTNFTLLTQTPTHTYIAQSGLTGNAPHHKTPMQWVPAATELASNQSSITYRFESPVVGGLQLNKTYVVHRGRYDIEVKHEIINKGDVPLQPAVYAQLLRDGQSNASATPFYSTFTGPAVYSETNKYQKVEFSDIDKKKATFNPSAKDGFVAMVQHYFFSAWLADEGLQRDNYVEHDPSNPKLYRAGFKLKEQTLAPGQTLTSDLRLFVGPQEEKTLEKIAPGLERVKDYGIFTLVAKPLYWLLEKIHQWIVPNWGWAIVLLVVLLKAAFYWLNASAYRSMAKMKAINPRIMEMRERLKSNPQQMQMEMMRMYREEKVNPLGGCLPILIQMPVFIALYWVLLSSVEMRHAPWMGWITDLSNPDPWYILPLVMAMTTVIQTALNPLPPDPLQAKMMWLMPIAFSVMFFFFPAGLVLYWITNNILTIAQQAFINHQMGVPMKFSMPDFRS